MAAERHKTMKYPIGIQTFERIIKEGYVYIDKTDLVYSLIQDSPICFLSRPRRFGKSLLLSTIKSYFLGKRDLFKGLRIDELETEWKKYPVFHIDFNGINFTRANALENSLSDYVNVWEQEYGVAQNKALSIGERFAKVLAAAHRQTNLGCVVLIDEYDKPMLDVMGENLSIDVDGNKMTIEENNRNILKSFYTTFKKADEDLRFVFLTGVTKFSQISVFSGFNQPKDISLYAKYDTICGITEEEIDRYFSQPIAYMSRDNGISTDALRAELRKRFDGYHFSKRMFGVYNPFSLLSTLDSHDIDDYWFASSTPTYLIRLLEHFDENMDEIAGRYFSKSEFIDYKADKERPLPMIFQSGYLTIKDYDKETDQFLLDFPNDEVGRGFLTIVANNYLGVKDIDTCNWIKDNISALRRGDLESFRSELTSFLASIPYSARPSSSEHEMERFFHYTFYLILRLASTYTTYYEKQQSRGRVDCVIETSKFVYIFEFKLNGTSKDALDQIDAMGYATEYATDSRKVYRIGCTFSSKTGTVEDWDVR